MEESVDYELLAKYLAAQCTPEEAVAVERWIHASPDREQYFQQFQEVWLAAEMDKSEPAPDTDASWQQLRGRMEKVRPLTTVAEAPEQVSYMKWWRLAAMILLAAGLGWGVYLLNKDHSVDVPTLVEQSTNNNKIAITLADGSQVWLNQYSQIRYPKGFKGQVNREVYLEGEAYFEVAHNPQQPFIIHTQRTVTRVLGTSFNVQAYQQDSVVTVSVASGKVAFYEAKQPTDQVLLLPAQQGVLVKATGKLVKQQINDPNYLSWQTGKLSFRNTPLNLVVQTLNRHYGAKITIKNPTLEHCKLTAQFENQTLTQVLEVIKLTLNIKYERSGNQILLTGAGC